MFFILRKLQMTPREKTVSEGTRLVMSKEQLLHSDMFPSPPMSWVDTKVGLITVPQDEKLRKYKWW